MVEAGLNRSCWERYIVIDDCILTTSQFRTRPRIVTGTWCDTFQDNTQILSRQIPFCILCDATFV